LAEKRMMLVKRRMGIGEGYEQRSS
jgi:hypothetical protein